MSNEPSSLHKSHTLKGVAAPPLSHAWTHTHLHPLEWTQGILQSPRVQCRLTAHMPDNQNLIQRVITAILWQLFFKDITIYFREKHLTNEAIVYQMCHTWKEGNRTYRNFLSRLCWWCWNDTKYNTKPVTFASCSSSFQYSYKQKDHKTFPQPWFSNPNGSRWAYFRHPWICHFLRKVVFWSQGRDAPYKTVVLNLF